MKTTVPPALLEAQIAPLPSPFVPTEIWLFSCQFEFPTVYCV